MKRLIFFLLLSCVGLYATGCSTNPQEHRDLSSWSPIEFKLKLKRAELDITAHRLDNTEYVLGAPTHYVVEGTGSFRHPESDEWILVELKFFLPKKTFKDGETLTVTATQRNLKDKSAPYFQYAEYKLGKEKGESLFTLNTPEAGQVSGEVTIIQALGDSFEASFKVTMSDTNNQTRNLSSGFFRYDPAPPRQ